MNKQNLSFALNCSFEKLCKKKRQKEECKITSQTCNYVQNYKSSILKINSDDRNSEYNFVNGRLLWSC